METVVILLASVLGATATFYLNVKRMLGPVKSSAWLSLVVGLYFHLFPDTLSAYYTDTIPLAFIGGSFIGMVSAQQLATYTGVGLAGILFGFIFLHTSSFFDGYGGALGTSACIALLVVLCIPGLKSKRHMTVGFLRLRKLMMKGTKKPNIG